MKNIKIILENKFGIAKAALSATPAAGQAAATGTGTELVKQAGGLASEKVLARALMPFVGRGIAGLLGSSLAGLLVPSELGDGSVSGQIAATLKKHFPEANHQALTAKIIMFNKINDRNALQFPDKRTIHSLAGTDMKDLQRQLEEKAKEIEPQGEPVAENIDSLDIDSTLSRPTREDLLNEPVAAYVIQRLEKAIQHLSGRIDKFEEFDVRLRNLEGFRLMVTRKMRDNPIATGVPAIQETREGKIFKNYFDKNKNSIKEQEENNQELAKVITDTVNNVLNELPDDSPAKNRETGPKMMDAIRRELQNPERLASIIDDVASEMGSELAETQDIEGDSP